MYILDLLKKKGILSEQAATEILTESEGGGVSIEAGLLARGVDPDVLLQNMGEYYRLPTRRIAPQEKIASDALRYIPEESARHYRFVPLEEKDGVLEVGITDPDNLQATDALNFISSKNNIPYKLVIILQEDFEKVLAGYENLTGEVDEALTDLESELTSDIEDRKKEAAETEVEKETVIKEDAPVTRIVATILRYAVDGHASDIHIEPTEEKVRVRFRVDGVLATSIELPIKIHTAIAARVKILASLRLDEKRKPQDGRFSATIDGRRIDFRVSSLPTYYGEKIVMRILDPDSTVRSLLSIGISDYYVPMIQEAVRQPHGIILISGPTGSGKSTTLYAMLSEVDRLGKNVISLEDPVEYKIDGVSQSQIRPEIGYTFASGLRTVLRQDPDVIMVGEIRDKETAQLAIQAALTGHLVLSTIHTNSAVGVIPRLIDMGVDPYLIAPTLILAMAQRLVRKICPDSGKEVPIKGSLQLMIEKEFAGLAPALKTRIPNVQSVLRAEPSAACPNGTRGRTVVMEVINVNDELENLILKGAGEDDLFQSARKNGFMSMREDAIIKAMKREIPFEEVNALGGMLIELDQDETIAAEAVAK
ncbi:GspE/PulE family protein [Patescibacteria group bacterium]|nr:GspE/PulE family protein [Patescibacteria group bacterium]